MIYPFNTTKGVGVIYTGFGYYYTHNGQKITNIYTTLRRLEKYGYKELSDYILRKINQ
jgi:hypothetical protein